MSAFADGNKIEIEMRSCWIKVGLTSEGSSPLSVGWEYRKTQTEGGHIKMGREFSCAVQNMLGSTRSRKRLGRILP